MSLAAYMLKNFDFSINPWIQAVKLGNLELVKLLHENNIPGYNNTVLDEATKFLDIFKFLLEKYPNQHNYYWFIGKLNINGDIQIINGIKEEFTLQELEVASLLANLK